MDFMQQKHPEITANAQKRVHESYTALMVLLQSRFVTENEYLDIRKRIDKELHKIG